MTSRKKIYYPFQSDGFYFHHGEGVKGDSNFCQEEKHLEANFCFQEKNQKVPSYDQKETSASDKDEIRSTRRVFCGYGERPVGKKQKQKRTDKEEVTSGCKLSGTHNSIGKSTVNLLFEGAVKNQTEKQQGLKRDKERMAEIKYLTNVRQSKYTRQRAEISIFFIGERKVHEESTKEGEEKKDSREKLKNAENNKSDQIIDHITAGRQTGFASCHVTRTPAGNGNDFFPAFSNYSGPFRSFAVSTSGGNFSGKSF
ncbi:hypothetical protein RUM43_011856 [Polyplax serrata]|uniref:Uncharacterized protein n=1 Tax=Polyplax serrata TaxID=468196 RepID=A0AAN8RZH5_POLSC